MTSPRRSIVRLLPPLALLLAGVPGLGCYKPNITEGGLKCNLDAGAKSCPEGFRCDLATQRCYTQLPDGSAERSETTDSDVGPICIEPTPGCVSSTTGLCDPACQTGCDCREKCSVNTVGAGALTCNVPRMQGYPRTLLQDCTIESAGSAAQTDNCDAGLVCIEDGCFPRCFKFCKNDGDCTNSSCTRDVGGGQKVCDVPFADGCTPLLSGGNMGCPVGAMACYLSSANPTHTICDCPLNAGMANDNCARSRECFPGLACVDRQTGASPKCLQICRLSNNGSDCPPPSTPGSCHPYTGLPPGTASHATFGYCY